ncbi:DEAD/DEAH box helicase [Leptothoe kymatousa]|uniref:DEAD/DEAH box helicase family protein n=1 Tax=Leptothoe kymatousa TAU-MAC 1615 TaxID=2364775 RepID=A0ABS5Y3Z1_9CYAN|nr:DEAD/DEAH box helicase [Leptothoe kymatousa]MBT9312564.1 DEAD/DEAH box helicase family protein [Leptothoe kymatousa TAU-MAC 1615]
MEIKLRRYQETMVVKLYRAINQGQRRLLWIALMGLGKTILASWVMRDAVSRGRTCVFLVPYTVLIDQTIETLQLLGVECSALQGSRKCDRNAPVIVASMQTITARLGKYSLDEILGHRDLIFVDEAHETAFHNKYPHLEEWVLSRGGYTVGMTATPWRLSSKQWLGQRFDIAIEGPQPPEAVKLGAVVPCRPFRIGGVFDLETLRVKSTGDYSEGDMSAQATRPEALRHVVREWRRLARDRATIMVGSTIEQAKATQDVFKTAGVATALIIGDTPIPERKRIFKQVEAGEVQIICSVGCLTAGFNLPVISCVLYVRATKSKSLFYQTAGRACRPAPEKTDFILLDFGGNVGRYGNPMAAQNYSIQGELIEQAPPSKTCPDCDAEVLVFAQMCPECGHMFSDGEELPEEPDTELGRLTEYVDKLTKQQIADLRRWRKEAWKAGTSPDLPIESFSHVYGFIPPAEWMQHACLGKRVSTRRKLKFVEYLENAYQGKPQWAERWLCHHLQIEFGTSDLSMICDRNWGDVLDLPYSASWQEVQQAYMERMRYTTDPADAVALNAALDDAKENLQTFSIPA